MQAVSAHYDAASERRTLAGNNYQTHGTDFAAMLSSLHVGTSTESLSFISSITDSAAQQVQEQQRAVHANKDKPQQAQNGQHDDAEASDKTAPSDDAATVLTPDLEAVDMSAWLQDKAAQTASIKVQGEKQALAQTPSDVPSAEAKLQTAADAKSQAAAQTMQQGDAALAAKFQQNAAAMQSMDDAASAKLQALKQSAFAAKQRLTLDAMAKELNVEQVSLSQFQPKTDVAAAAKNLAASAQLTISADAFQDDLTKQLALKQALAEEAAAAHSNAPKGSELLTKLKADAQNLQANNAAVNGTADAKQALQVLAQGAQGSIAAGQNSSYNLEQVRRRQGMTLEHMLGAKAHPANLSALGERTLLTADGNAEGISGLNASSSVTAAGMSSGSANSDGGSSGSSAQYGFHAMVPELKAALKSGRAGSSTAPAPMELTDDSERNAQRIAEQVQQMAARNLRQLTIDLNPASLGRMQIAIALNPQNEALSVSIGAGTRTTKDLISKSLPALQALLAGADDDAAVPAENPAAVTAGTAAQQAAFNSSAAIQPSLLTLMVTDLPAHAGQVSASDSINLLSVLSSRSSFIRGTAAAQSALPEGLRFKV